MATKSWEGGVASAPSAAAEISSAALRAFVAASLVGSPHDSQNRKDAEATAVSETDTVFADILT